MKEGFTLLPMQRWASGAGGALATYRIPAQLRDQLSQYDDIIVQLIGTDTDPTAKAQLKMYATPTDQIAPADIAGTNPFWTGTAITG